MSNEEIYNKYIHQIRKAVEKSGIQEIDDVVHDIMLSVFNKPYNFDNKNLNGWVYFITSNHISKLLKKKKKELPLVEERFTDIDHLEETEKKVQLRKAIKKAPKINQVIVEMYYWEEIQVKHICGIVNLNLNKTQRLLEQTRTFLKMYLSGDYYGIKRSKTFRTWI